MPETSERPVIEWCGKRHIEMTREELMDFVEALDWGIADLRGKMGDASHTDPG